MQEEKLFCENCGKQLKPDAEFCPYCGAPVQRVPEEKPEEVPPEKPLPPGNHRKLVAAIVIGAVMVGAVAAGIFFIAPRILDSQAKNTSEAAVSAASKTEDSAPSSVSSASVSKADVSRAASAGTSSAAAAAPTPSAAATPAAVTAAPAATITPTPAAAITPAPAATSTPTPAATITPAAVTPAPAAGRSSFDADTADSYWWPESNTRYYSESDLEGKSALQLHYIINEIYARRGYIFAKQEWAAYFGQKSWYHPTTPADQFSDSIFNQYEKANIDLVNAYQAAHYPNDV